MKYLFLNHKMNMTSVDIVEYIEGIKNIDKNNDNLELTVFPSYIYIPYFFGQAIKTGSQDVSTYSMGAFTGCISAKQLKSLGVKYSIVGHSERRTLFDEWDEDINEKILRLQENDIIPVLCIGEKRKEEREETIVRQINKGLQDADLDKIIIAYEPIYSIGTGVPLETTEIEKAVRFIKNHVKVTYNKNIPVLYGGSVDETNISKLAKISNVDGFLVGSASLDIKNVKTMYEEMIKNLK